MNPLLISYSDSNGGAFRAAKRTHDSLLSVDIDSTLLVRNKNSEANSVASVDTLHESPMYERSRVHLDRLPVWLYRGRGGSAFSVSWLPNNVRQVVDDHDPDLVHLHWINNGMIRTEDIGKLDRPVVWTLHDMWPFTGGCHYTRGCTRYQNGCGKCPQLDSNWSFDLSKVNYKRKKKSFSKEITVVTPSEWLAGHVRSSPLFEGCTVETIPNPLDTEKYSPVEGKKKYRTFGLDPDTSIVLFGSDLDNPRKGSHHVPKVMKRLSRQVADVELVTFGGGNSEVENSTIPHTSVGRIPDAKLQLLYSAADVTLVPSVQEVFGQVATESMSSGTPVVAFDTGGLAEIVDHRTTGYLADVGDTDGLVEGVRHCLKNKKTLSTRARRESVENYSMDKVGKQYRELYRRIV